MSAPLGTGSILIAPDKFKGSLTAGQVAQAIATGLRRVLTTVDLRCLPVADGGEGTVDAALAAGFQRRQTEVSGPLSKPVTASWAWQDHRGRREAVVELAQASGIELIQPDRTTGRAATSRGTGELLQRSEERRVGKEGSSRRTGNRTSKQARAERRVEQAHGHV